MEVEAEATVNNENLFENIKDNLNGQPGQPIVLGVCNALAARFDQERWVFRAGFIALALFWTSLTLVVYVVLGLVMMETETRTRGVFQGLFVTLREVVDKCIEACRSLFDPHMNRRDSTRY